MNQKAFSLIEVMIVVSLIATLAVVGIVNYNKFVSKAYQSEAKAQLATLYTAQKSFYFEYNSYYSSLAALGYAPYGKTRINIGFGAYDGSLTTEHPIPPNYQMSTKLICTGSGGVGADLNCNMVVKTPNIERSLIVSSRTFLASAAWYEDFPLAFNLKKSNQLVQMISKFLRFVSVQPVFAAYESPTYDSAKCDTRTDLSIETYGINHNKVLKSRKLSLGEISPSSYEPGCSNSQAAALCPVPTVVVSDDDGWHCE